MKVELFDVRKQFGRQTALDGIDLVFESGSRTALVGPNGSGKSTLIRAIMGTITAEGKALFDQQEVSGQPALDHSLAYIPQFAPQTRAPVGDLVDAVVQLRGLTTSAVEQCAGELGFRIENHFGKAVADLSGGMRQKLMIALALAAPVDLLVMDEPTASLDADARAAFLGLFDRVAAGTTVILASHRPDELRSLVDRLVLLQDGRVAYHGEARQFLARRARTVIELRCAEDTDTAWLPPLGFKQVHPRQWIGVFDSERKAAVLGELGWHRQRGLDDLIVQEVENIDLDSAEASHVE